MKRTVQLAVVASLIFAAHGAMSAPTESPYPSDAEASYNLPASDTYQDQHARAGTMEQSENWGVGKRQPVKPHDPYPFGGGPVDD
jgi:hypothetical protein